MHILRKTSVLTVALALMLALLFGAVALLGGKAANGVTGPEVNPILVSGNPSCADRGFDYELRIDASELANNQTYTAATTVDLDDSGPLSVTLSGLVFDSNNEVVKFNWASNNYAVDEVLVKASNNANAFVYDPPKESMGDDGLYGPENKGISHISFCYDLELQVSKTANTELTRTYKWTIDKSVTPGTWNLFTGDSGTSKYTVSVNKDEGTDSNWKVSGTITVTAPVDATVTKVTDVISPSTAANVECPGTTFPVQLNAGQTLDCTYSANLPDGSPRTNTATAISGTDGVKDGSGTASVDFSKAKINKVNDSIAVNDSYAGAGSPWTFSDDGSKSYDRKFTCDGDEGTHDNTATIRETGQSDSAQVKVNCYALDVKKDANTSSTRTYHWTIDKTADPTEKTIATGDTFQASYSVKVDATYTDGNRKVDGQITVSNPADAPDATINSVSDVVSGAGAANVDCGTTTFPHTLAAGDTLTCSYNKDLPDTSTRTNTATATLQNHEYDSTGNATNSGTTDFSGTAAVNFGGPTTEVDKSITVSDPVAPNGGTLGTATYGVDDLPKTFDVYSQTIGPYNTCGDKTVDNTASFTGSDGASGSDTATVTAHVQCKLTVIKQLEPATDSGKFNLQIDGVTKAANVGDEGTTGAVPVALGNHTVGETAGTNTILSDYKSKINCGGADVAGTSTTVSFQSGDSDKTCTITNTKQGKVTVLKTTNGVVNPTKSINFTLTGPGLPTTGITLSTSGDQDGVLDFGSKLNPGEQYTVCENPVPAGWTSFWKLDGAIVTPYNPDATKSPPEDMGVRCYNFSANAGQTRSFVIDNSFPGGDPRTIGYWKNWNRCTSGNQATTATKNGGAAAGFFLLEDLLPQLVGDFNVTTCAQAVKVLSKQDQSARNQAKDAAYELAAQLLAARLNLAAGAETCTAVETAVTNGQALLDQINFTGSNSYLTKSSTNRTKALSLAATLDKYNNGSLC